MGSAAVARAAAMAGSAVDTLAGTVVSAVAAGAEAHGSAVASPKDRFLSREANREYVTLVASLAAPAAGATNTTASVSSKMHLFQEDEEEDNRCSNANGTHFCCGAPPVKGELLNGLHNNSNVNVTAHSALNNNAKKNGQQGRTSVPANAPVAWHTIAPSFSTTLLVAKLLTVASSLHHSLAAARLGSGSLSVDVESWRSLTFREALSLIWPLPDTVPFGRQHLSQQSVGSSPIFTTLLTRQSKEEYLLSLQAKLGQQQHLNTDCDKERLSSSVSNSNDRESQSLFLLHARGLVPAADAASVAHALMCALPPLHAQARAVQARRTLLWAHGVVSAVAIAAPVSLGSAAAQMNRERNVADDGVFSRLNSASASAELSRASASASRVATPAPTPAASPHCLLVLAARAALSVFAEPPLLQRGELAYLAECVPSLALPVAPALRLAFAAMYGATTELKSKNGANVILQTPESANNVFAESVLGAKTLTASELVMVALLGGANEYAHYPQSLLTVATAVLSQHSLNLQNSGNAKTHNSLALLPSLVTSFQSLPAPHIVVPVLLRLALNLIEATPALASAAATRAPTVRYRQQAQMQTHPDSHPFRSVQAQ